MRKFLIITYYWPPSGGAGVQRWLKFIKYLRQFGWEPIVYTPENGEIPVTDKSLEKDIPENLTVLKQPIWEPYSVYKKLVGQKKEEKINTGFLTEKNKPRLVEKISVWIRGNFFIPDARKFWIKPSVKFLTNYLQKNQIDIIISSGPPHSMHLIAAELKKAMNIKWIADFRDPWTDIDFYEDLMLTKWADKKHHELEKMVLLNADRVICIGETMKNELAQKVENGLNKFEVISNGYDEDDLSTGVIEMDKKFSIAHIGTMVKSRNPQILWRTLSQLTKEDENFANTLEIKLVGKIDITITKSIEQYNLQKFLKKTEYLSHAEIIKVQQQSQVLLLLINDTKNAKGILTGKFFEYLSAKRPILAIGPENGDAAKILSETGSGVISEFNNEGVLKKNILHYYELFKIGNLKIESKETHQYSRRELTKKLSNILSSL